MPLQEHDLNTLMVFARVAEHGSFTAGAKALGVSKSAASKYVARLEDRLGARLLNRTTRKLSLTEVGQAFFERCQNILAELEAAEQAVTQLQDEPRGTLRVNAPMSFGIRHMAPAVAAFMGLYPDLTIDLTLDDRTVDVVDEGYDLVIRITALPDSTLIARKLAPFRTVICAAPGYWREHGKPAHPGDLTDHTCLGYTYLQTQNEWRFEEDGTPVGVKVTERLRSNNGDVLSAAALAGNGVVRAPYFIVGPDLTAGRLESALENFEETGRGIFAVYPHNRHLSAKVRVFVDFLAERFRGGAFWGADQT